MVSYQDYYNGVMGRGGNRPGIDPEAVRRMMQYGSVYGQPSPAGQRSSPMFKGDMGQGPWGGGLPAYGQAPPPPQFIRSQTGMQSPNYGRAPLYQPNFSRPMYQNTSFQQPAQLPRYGGGGGNYSNTSFLQPAGAPEYGNLDPNRFVPF